MSDTACLSSDTPLDKEKGGESLISVQGGEHSHGRGVQDFARKFQNRKPTDTFEIRNHPVKNYPVFPG